MDTRHWCTAEQAAHRLGLPVGTVKRLVGAGVLSSGRVGRLRALDIDDVERYANRRRGVGIR
ncbi:MAG: helix-turn-helix domain-containing protein [Actinomycetia bacterium]|nr:helix-turn-helix domain-containing protein [Actinomycetes bacterium]